VAANAALPLLRQLACRCPSRRLFAGCLGGGHGGSCMFFVGSWLGNVLGDFMGESFDDSDARECHFACRRRRVPEHCLPWTKAMSISHK
jgi:hypothetical protein